MAGKFEDNGAFSDILKDLEWCGFDGIIDVCEMKYSKDSYTITSDYADELAPKRNVFQSVTGTKKAIHSIMVTIDGLSRNEYWGDIQAEIQLDDLYEL